MQGEELAGELDDQEVQDDYDKPDDEEGWVAPEVFADVDLIVNFSGGYHIDDLQPDEQVEDESKVTRIIIAYKPSDKRKVKLISVDSVLSARENFVVGLPIRVAKQAPLFVETKILVGFRNNIFTSEEENEKNSHLEDRHPYDVLTHFTSYNEVSFFQRHTEKKFGLWLFSCKCQRSKRVHNHVYPKELDSL